MYIFVYIFSNLNSRGEFDYSKVCTFALTLKNVFSSFSKKSSRKRLPLRCTLLSLSIVIQMLLFQNNLIIVVTVGLNCLVVII